jgi:hypothetical protein
LSATLMGLGAVASGAGSNKRKSWGYVVQRHVTRPFRVAPYT